MPGLIGEDGGHLTEAAPDFDYRDPSGLEAKSRGSLQSPGRLCRHGLTKKRRTQISYVARKVDAIRDIECVQRKCDTRSVLLGFP